MDKVRIGVLGAARITPLALIRPARRVEEAEVVAVAARDRGRAGAFAGRHGIPKVHASYDHLIADPDVDAIYNPLPNGLHAAWTAKALEAGKHVLCEKPFTANAAEAERLAELASEKQRVVMEAFHYRYHPLATRMREILDAGTLGAIRHVETWVCFPLPLPGDIRYRYDLGGGATMDAGCYAIHLLRLLAGGEPKVTFARARLASPQVDRYMTARFEFGNGLSGRMTCSLWSSTLLRVAARVVGERGRMDVFNPLMPSMYHRLKVKTPEATVIEHREKEWTYVFQLRAFAAAVLRGEPVLTPPSDSVANMRVIDSVYEAAGLRLRGTGSVVSS